MSKKVLISIYYGLFHSIAAYGIIAWGNAYKNVINSLYNLQARVLKIVGVNCIEQKPLTLRQTFIYELLLMNYRSLRQRYMCSKIKTRNKGITFYKCKNQFGQKNFSFTALNVFNRLPRSLKILNGMLSTIGKKLKNWIQVNY